MYSLYAFRFLFVFTSKSWFASCQNYFLVFWSKWEYLILKHITLLRIRYENYGPKYLQI